MNESTITVRYAKAMFLLAEEKGLIEEVRNDMLVIANIIKESDAFRFFFFSPTNKPSLKLSTLDLLFGNQKIQGITLNFLKILIEKNRFHFLEDITRNYTDIYKKHKGIKSVNFQSVYEPSENIKNQVTTVLKNFYKAEIELHVDINPELIGGFLLRVDDQQYDASIATALKKMKTTLKDQ